MQIPPEISIKGFEITAAIDNLLQNQITRLERVCGYITSIRVAIEKEQGRHQSGNPYRIRLDIRVPPNHEMVVRRLTVLHGEMKVSIEAESELEMAEKKRPRFRKDEPLPAAIKNTFDSARRQLERIVERQRKEIKAHPQNQIKGFIEKLFRDDAYGFIRAIEGQQVYFHKHSVLRNDWERLQVGTGVRFIEEPGEKGLQASSLEIVDKPGVSEMHAEMHELPVVTVKRSLPRGGVRARIPAT
ncbi:MAG: HPF/RaiA family ribosome-associated protein [Dehalococcoidales bacterium]|nr:HPF/RaiA family ribosome-associated protein [Dehalococcoidales bacterium]